MGAAGIGVASVITGTAIALAAATVGTMVTTAAGAAIGSAVGAFIEHQTDTVKEKKD